MPHVINEAAEAILEQTIPVLDHGFVRLVDYLGGDSRVVSAARVSYGDGTKTLREDEGLIRYLMRNHHTSPFEQVVFTFHCKMPIFVARQWVRHRTARLNEVSGRYSVLKSEFYMPTELKSQDKKNRQGSAEPLDTSTQYLAKQEILHIYEEADKAYHRLLDLGVSRELARMVLPLSTYTEWYWQMDLHNLLHFLKLRLDSHAQYEIRVYAEAMANIVEAVAPISWQAFLETHYD